MSTTAARATPDETPPATSTRPGGRLGRGEVDALDGLLSPDYRRRSAGDDEGLTRDQFKATITTTRTAFPDLVTTVEDVVVEGDRAAVRWHSVGTHQHSVPRRAADRALGEVYGATFATFGEDGPSSRSRSPGTRGRCSPRSASSRWA